MNKAKVIDGTKSAYTAFGVGIKKGNPKRCLKCGRPIKRGHAWRADASAVDPKYGRYVVIHHSPQCPNQKARTAFQKMVVGGKRR